MLEDKPNITISFAGLMIYYIKKDKEGEDKELQVAIVNCPDHEPIIDIHEITMDEKTGEYEGSRLIHQSRVDSNINIKNSESNRVKQDIYDQVVFDRKLDLGEPRDFRWIINLEGEEFGGKEMKIKAIPGAPPKRLGPIITIKDGVIYTERRSDEKFAVISLCNTESKPKYLGRMAYRVGVDIILNNGAVVVLRTGNPADELPALENKPLTKYHINIENICHPTEPRREGTDFRYIFDVVRNEDDERFDLLRIVENRGCGGVEDFLAGRADFSLDSDMQPCNGAGFSGTDGF